MNNDKTNRSSSWQRDIFSGGLAGAFAGTLGFPFLIMKKRSQMQMGEFKFSRLFLGLPTFASSIIVNTAIIVGAKNMLGRFLSENHQQVNDADQSSDNNNSFITTSFAGLIAAFPVTFVDNVIVTQQLRRINGSLAFKQIIKNSPYGLLVSYPALAFRETLYSTAMFYGAAQFRQFLQSNYGIDSYYWPIIPVAFVCCGISQPFDTIAGVQQYYMAERNQSLSIVDTARHVYKTRGMAGFLRGSPYRLGLMTVCFGVIPTAEEYLNNVWDNRSSFFGSLSPSASNELMASSPEPSLPESPGCKGP